MALKKMTLEQKMQRLEANATDRRKLFHDLCNHVSKGLSLESFPKISDNTIYRFLRDFPGEFKQDELELARKEGREWWENIGRRQAMGDCLGNSRTWYYNMANRYGWREKLDIEAEHKGSVSVNIVSYASSKASQDSVSKKGQ